MARRRHDWHREDIKAAIRRTGITLEALSIAHNIHKSACAIAIRRPWPRVEAIIAAHLGTTPQAIWPSRYDASGAPLNWSQITHWPEPAPMQKRKAG